MFPDRKRLAKERPMRNTTLLAVVAALAMAGSPGARAQPQQQAPSASEMAATCAQMRGMPNPPMTYDACMQMATSMGAMQAAQTDPRGIRPGDDAMSCDQLKAEFIANGGLNMNQQDAAAAQRAGQNLQATTAQATAEAEAEQARGTATTAAAAAAAGAAEAANATSQAAQGAKTTAQITGAEQQASAANAQVMGDMATQMQSNPRQARLIYLAQQKNCHW
jgi:hypothetical protein